MMTRAYGVLELRDFDDARREFEGIATSIGTDRYGDIVESQGAQFNLPIAFLWQHDAQRPVGHVIEATPRRNDIAVRVRMVAPNSDAPQSWAERLNSAWHDVKSGLVRGLSIGFNPKESVPIDGGYGRRYLRWEWLELSGVTIPANAEATITTIKSFDQQLQTGNALARRGPVRLIPAGRGGIKLITKP